MSEFDDYDVKLIAYELEYYLIEHPNAADTVEGITKWWLPRQGIEVPTALVDQALGYLTAKSILKSTANSYGNKVYSSNTSQT